MACQEIWPVEVCGPRGSCENGTVCVCEPGWSHTLEFQFESLNEESTLCSYNDNSVQKLYLVTGILGILVFLQMVIVVIVSPGRKRLRRFVTGLPVLGIGALFTFVGLYRYTNPEVRHSKEHIVFTALNFQGFALILVSTNDCFLRIMAARVRKGEWSSTGVEKHINSYKKTAFRLNIADLVLAQLLWLSYLAKPEVGRLMFRFFCATQFIHELYLLYFTYIFIRRYHIDVEKIARFKFGLSANESITQDAEAELWTEIERKKMKPLYVLVLVYICTTFFLIWCPLFSDLWLQSYTPYVIPIMACLFSLTTLIWICVLMARKKIQIGNKGALRNEGFVRNVFAKRLQADGSITRVDNFASSNGSSDNTDSDSDSDSLV